MEIYIFAALILTAISLILLIVLQSKGAGLGGLGGGNVGGGTGYHARRGVERLLFNLTIGLSILFFMLNIAAVLVN